MTTEMGGAGEAEQRADLIVSVGAAADRKKKKKAPGFTATRSGVVGRRVRQAARGLREELQVPCRRGTQLRGGTSEGGGASTAAGSSYQLWKR